jgi:hypothetical protein
MRGDGDAGMIDRLLYGLTFRGDWIASIVARIFFRFRCPYPLLTDHSVRACKRAGLCGCDNR